MTDNIRERFVKIQKRNNDGNDIYTASLSSDYPVERFGFTEILEHKNDSINMERASNGLALLFNHDVDNVIGRVNDIRLRNDGKLEGNLIFSQTPNGQERKTQVDEGTLTDISIRYSIDEENEQVDQDSNKRTYTVTRWTPMEASVVTVPADHTVGIGRNFETTTKRGNTMNDKTTTPAGGDNATDSGVVVSFESARQAGEADGINVERQRQSEINALFSLPAYQDATCQALRMSLIEGGASIEQSRSKLLDYIGKTGDVDTYVAPQPKTEQGARSVIIRTTEDGIDNAMEGIRNAVDVKMRSGTKEELAEKSRGNQYVGASFTDIARECLRLQGVDDVYRYDARTAVGFALQPLALPSTAMRNFVGHGTSQFASVVENIAGKQLMQGFNEAEETWRAFCRVGSVSSFRQESRVDVSSFSDLDEVAENGEYTHGTFSDRKEYIQAKKYGKLVSLTRELLVNDDIQAMQDILRQMGRSAERKTGDLVYAILNNSTATTAAYVMGDGGALCSARSATTSSGTNLRTSGAAPSVSELDAMKVIMSGMKDFNGNAVGSGHNISYLIVPKALETTAMILQNAASDPDQKSTQSGGGGTRPNPFTNTFQTVSDNRLNATVYYGMSDPNLVPVIEVAYLNGQQSPSLESENGFTVDGITYKVRLEVAAKALNWTGIVRNAGA
jgi:HK97 family phage prohead protease